MSTPKAAYRTQPLSKAVKVIQKIDQQLNYAVALHQMFDSLCANNVLSNATRGHNLARGRDLLLNSLWYELVLSITRLHDKDTRSASFPSVISLFTNPAVQKHLCDPKAADTAKSSYDKLSKSCRKKRLFKLRNKILAHSDMTPVTRDTAGVGDTEKILQRSIAIGAHLTKAVTGQVSSVSQKWEDWLAVSRDFGRGSIRSSG